MPLLNLQNLLEQLRLDFPAVTFAEGEVFVWSPLSSTITFVTYEGAQEATWQLLHEVAHADLKHFDAELDVELIKCEAAAWTHAQTVLAARYRLTIPEAFAEDNLDTYRDWLHARSTCPDCAQTGLQTQKNAYSCLNCRRSWGVNDARTCGLRRTKLPDQNKSKTYSLSGA